MLALATAALLPAGTTADVWPNAGDIPTAEPVTVGLAGEKPADVVRYLLAQGAKAAELSLDAGKLAFEWAVTASRSCGSSMPQAGGRSRLLSAAPLRSFAGRRTGRICWSGAMPKAMNAKVITSYRRMAARNASCFRSPMRFGSSACFRLTATR